MAPWTMTRRHIDTAVICRILRPLFLDCPRSNAVDSYRTPLFTRIWGPYAFAWDRENGPTRRNESILQTGSLAWSLNCFHTVQYRYCLK
jgi:hypothetical protein